MLSKMTIIYAVQNKKNPVDPAFRGINPVKNFYAGIPKDFIA